jgi:hypothetical protein
MEGGSEKDLPLSHLKLQASNLILKALRFTAIRRITYSKEGALIRFVGNKYFQH